MSLDMELPFKKSFYFSMCLLGMTLFLENPCFSSSSSSESLKEVKEKKLRAISLEENVDTLKLKIQRAQNDRSAAALLKLNVEFDKWEYDSKEWEGQGKRLNVENWPNQNWKQSIGGYLFYPPQIENFLSSDFTRHLVKRRDITWSFAIASHHRHPLAQYYLAHTLEELRQENGFEPRPPLLDFLYGESLSILEKCPNVPQACYIVASNYAFESSKVGKREFNLKLSLEFHEKGAHHNSSAGYQNRLALLVKRSLYPSLDLPFPKKKDYLSVGEYGPAYVYAASLSKKFKNREDLLKKAINFNFPQAYLHLGALYEEKGKTQDALECYEQAGHSGVPRGYILLSQSLVGNQTSRYEAHDLTKISRENLERAISYLEKAGEAGDVEGWDHLLGLYRNLYEHFKNEEDLRALLVVLEKGFQMNSSYVHHQTQSMFPSRKYKQFTSLYGSPDREDIITYLSDKLKFKSEKE